jgi:hypothetical protein
MRAEIGCREHCIDRQRECGAGGCSDSSRCRRANTLPGFYDILGKRFWVGASFSF